MIVVTLLTWMAVSEGWDKTHSGDRSMPGLPCNLVSLGFQEYRGCRTCQLVPSKGIIAGKLKLQPRNFINNNENNKRCSKPHVPFGQEHQENLIHPTGVTGQMKKEGEEKVRGYQKTEKSFRRG